MLASTYDVLYRVVFGLDLVLIFWVFLVSVATMVLYWRQTVKEPGNARLRRTFKHVGFVAGGISWLLFGAAMSLFESSLVVYDWTIFLYPPGFVALGYGITNLLRHGQLYGGKK